MVQSRMSYSVLLRRTWLLGTPHPCRRLPREGGLGVVKEYIRYRTSPRRGLPKACGTTSVTQFDGGVGDQPGLAAFWDSIPSRCGGIKYRDGRDGTFGR